MSNMQKVAIVTGASQGIGAALVEAFRGRGYRVVANSRSIKAAADPDIVTVPGDVGDPKTAELVFKQALDRFGRVDTLVNNAGIFRFVFHEIRDRIVGIEFVDPRRRRRLRSAYA